VTFTDVGEQIFGGDLLTVTTAMQKFVHQIDDHLKDSNEEEKMVALVHKVNQVWNFNIFVDGLESIDIASVECINLINSYN